MLGRWTPQLSLSAVHAYRKGMDILAQSAFWLRELFSHRYQQAVGCPCPLSFFHAMNGRGFLKETIVIFLKHPVRAPSRTPRLLRSLATNIRSSHRWPLERCGSTLVAPPRFPAGRGCRG